MHGGHVGHVSWTVFPQSKEALYEIVLRSTCPEAFEEMFDNAFVCESWVKGRIMAVTSYSHKSSCTY